MCVVCLTEPSNKGPRSTLQRIWSVSSIPFVLLFNFMLGLLSGVVDHEHRVDSLRANNIALAMQLLYPDENARLRKKAAWARLKKSKKKPESN